MNRGLGLDGSSPRGEKGVSVFLDKIVCVSQCFYCIIESCGGGRDASLCGLMDG